MIKIKLFLVVQLIFSLGLCEINNGQKEKLLNGFLKYYNSLPNQIYQSEEGSLQSTQQVDDTTYQIEANLRVAEITNNEEKKQLKCIASIKDSENEVTVLSSHCEDAVELNQRSNGNLETTLEAQVEVSEPTVERKPVQLVNEVDSDTAITSGEQFIAIPRDQPIAPCIGCASHVNPQAAGVSDLATLGVRHLDLHEPSVKHSLASVMDVERQVQVVNGVRYILTLSVNFNNCTQIEAENCASFKICKITILVKPWVKLSNGGNYRAILANNCTEEWQFGDNGEVLPEVAGTGDPGDINAFDGVIQVKHDTNVQSQPNQERSLTDEDIKKIQEQIITVAQFQEVTESNRQSFTLSPDVSDVSKQHVFKVESDKHNENSIPVTESAITEKQALKLNLDKKKAIDEMLDFFDFSGFKPKPVVEEVVPRVRRSYDYDLQVLSLAEDFHGIKNSIENARFMYEMAQAVVDYMNEMDMEVKNRAVKNVIRAEEEKENLQRFVYIQVRVTIPCDKVECEPRDVDTQICNGVIDCSNENNPQILSTFCYKDNKDSDYREDIREVSLNDPVLRTLAEEAVNKIESESKSQYALRINKIASAITQVTSGTLTKFSVIVENMKCNKSVPVSLRINCTVLEQLGSKICDVIVHERHWLKEKKISYSCTDRPADMRMSKSKKVSKNITVDDPQIIQMLQEAIQYLESQSDKTNKQKIVNIKSISSQIIAGFLTKIEFVVGYTDCTDENYSRAQINKCELLKGEQLRSCKAQIWDRSWIMDGRQIEVSCDEISKNNEIGNSRKKRSIDSTRDQEQQSLNKDNDLDFLKLANDSLYRFMQSSSSNQHYKVVKIDRAESLDASRKLIKIDFSISPTNCLIQNNGVSPSECNIVNSKNVLHCRSKILENNWISKKQYFVKCNIKYQHQKNTNMMKERNPSESKYYQLAEESLTKYLHDTGNPQHTIVRVEKVTTQIVSGLLTRIDFIVSPTNLSVSNSKSVRCHSEILEKHWMGTKAINVSCQMKQDVQTMDHTIQVNVNDPKYMQIAVESLQKYIKNKPESKLVRVAFVDKVERKGDQLKIRFIASHAEEVDGDTLCYAEVSESTREIEVKCHLIGQLFRKAEITDDDPNYYKYVQLADESLRNYLQKMNSSFYTIVTIESVAVLWDEGIKTLINFTISPIDSENSDLLQGKQCIAEILEQPWLQNSNKKNSSVQCKLDKDMYRNKRGAPNNRVRRQLGHELGGRMDQNPNDPRYKALADESLQQYTIDHSITERLTVEQVEKVSTQFVEGSLTRIDFLVSGSSDYKTLKCHSEIWEKSWEKFKHITVTCDNDSHKNKRGIPGGETYQDPNDPRYKALADESLQQYTIDHGITERLTVELVEKVSTQVVAGSLTRIDFLVSGSSDSKTLKCHSEIWEKSWEKFKQVTVTCGNGSHRGKRQILGGLKDQDPSKPEYKTLADESLQQYTIDHGITELLRVEQVEKVSTQVVAGSLTRIDFLVSGSSDYKTFKCHSEIWEKSWQKFKQITVTCDNDSHKNKRGIPGGETYQDPNDPRYKALADESLQQYTIDHGITERLTVELVEKVSTQVVAGSLTRIDFLVSGSSDYKTLKCHSEIWEKSWEKFKHITVTCDNDSHKNKRGIPGGETYQDPNDPRYKALADESLLQYTIDHGITERLTVELVEKVSTQVVAGSLTRIDFLVSGSSDSKTLKCHSEIWEKSWQKFKQITVTCDNDSHKNKRGIPGGETYQDPNDPRYKALADESLQQYTIDHGITERLTVELVEKVSTQVVAGSLTRIDFLVSGSSDSKTLKCHSEIWEKSWQKFKQITVTCDNDSHKNKRGIPGGETYQDPNDPRYKALADESLQQYTIDHGITERLTVELVEKVSTQVVAGSLTRIDFLVSGSSDYKTLKCHSEIWEKSWEKFKHITVTCDNDSHKYKRGIPGGETYQDPNDPRYKALADESLQQYTIDHGITERLTVELVEKVSTQVVAGSLTRIDFLVSGSSDYKTLKCHSEIWEKSWQKFKQITVTCDNDSHKNKRGIPGGETYQDPNDPRYKALADESLQQYTIDHGITERLTVELVEKVSTQVVAGSLTRIDFLVSGSSDSKTLKCHSEIWEKSWEKFKHITVTCDNDSHKNKRGIPGGETYQDPNDPRYKALADESLQQYTIDHGITERLTVELVEKVSTQVVAGSLTRIDFLVSGSSDSKTLKCHSEIWEKSWQKFKQITVTCDNDSHKNKRGIPGGETYQDPNDPRYKALADESLQQYTIDHGITERLTVELVEKVSTQVVAGSLTRIDFLVSGSSDYKTLKCHSEIWEKSWEKFKHITVTCDNDSHKNKRGIPGGETYQDPNDPRYKALADESLQQYTIDHGITERLTVELVEKVSTQVVAGSLTRIDFLVSGSSDSKTLKCHSEIWEKSWEKFKQVTVTCGNGSHRGKRQILGGLEDQDPSKPEYKTLADESLQQYTIDHGITELLRVEQIEKVSTQVVAGSLTRIDFLVSGSSDYKTFKCHSEIWEKSWQKFKQITVTCDNDSHKNKRGIPGGGTYQDPNDPRYKALADESLQQYTIDHGITERLTVELVEKVSTQVVAGSLTRIDFLVSGSSDYKTLKCHSEIWEKSWEKFKHITVTCDNDSHKNKRGIPGGETYQDPNDPRYKALADESLLQYTIDHGITERLTVELVEKVSTQVVAGSLTRIDFLVSGSSDYKTLKCHSEIWEKSWEKFKHITVTCDNDSHKNKRGIPGGKTYQDPNDPRYKALADESLQQYTIDHGITERLTVELVEKVSTQVVAGSLTRIDFLVSGSSDSKTLKCHSEIWEKSWQKFKQITVTCDNDSHKNKRGIPGGETYQDPNDPRSKALADESLQQYTINHGITERLTVELVEKVSTQVVAGSLTRIDFLVSGSSDYKTLKCHSEIWEKSWEKFKHITVTCDNDSHKNKRGIPGGETYQDPNDPRYKALADESLQQYTIDHGITERLTVELVEKVSTQVVAGSLTRIDFLVSGSSDSKILKCHSEIWEKSWEKFKQVTVTCGNGSHRGKRQILGGLEDQDPSKPEYKTLADESLQQYTIDHGITELLRVEQIEKVSTQVVAGSLTRIDFLVSGSSDYKTFKCHSEIWEKSWQKFKQITVTCDNDSHKNKRGIPGGETYQDPNDPRYKALADESLQQYTIDHGITERLTVELVEKVSTQVVAGSLTRIDFLVSGSSDYKTLKCHSEIWEKSWEKFKHITVTCDNDSHKNKRGIPGGETYQDPNDPRYKALADESLQQYTIDHGITERLTVELVEKVSTQVVAGSLTRIDFLVSGSSDYKTLKCHSEIWEKSWEKFKHITVTCDNDSHKYKRGIPGGETYQDPNDPRYKALADESLQQYTIDHGITERLTVELVEKVSTQVVAGSMTRIDFLVSGSSDYKTLKCHSEIWEKSWEKFKHITVTCDNDSHKNKRGIPGDETYQDPNDPRYKALAYESLQQYLFDHSVRVERVEKVTTQVVDGILTRIDFVVSDSSDYKTFMCHSAIWEKSGEKLKQIKLSCDNDSQKNIRGITGGKTYQDPNDPRYKALADESLQQYSIEHGIIERLRVERVEKVTTQIVAGIMTRIDFVVSGSFDSKTVKCHSAIWEKGWENVKQITVTCDNDSHKNKRGIPGDETYQDPNDPRYKALAYESLQQYLLDHSVRVERVEKVTTQVVDGILTRIDFVVSDSSDYKTFMCHSAIWEKSGEKLKHIKLSCDNDSHKNKREITGGKTYQDPNDPRYKALADESLQQYSIEHGIIERLRVERVEKVTTQIVAGIMTRIDFVVSGSFDSKTVKCHSAIWEKGWENVKQITVTCDNDSHKNKREITGGKTYQDPNDPRYKALADESLQQYSIEHGIIERLRVERVETVTTQIVAGIMTRIDFVVFGSFDSKTVKCHSAIWEKSWEKFKQITVTCDNDSHKNKRAIPGGETYQDPNDPRYKALADESLQKYTIDHGITERLTVEQIEKVSTQVVAGSLTRIDFLVSGSSDYETFKCHSEIWEKGWEKFKQITVTCEDDGHRGKGGKPGSRLVIRRVKRDLGLLSGAKQNLGTPRYKVLTMESNRGNNSFKDQQHDISTLRGHIEEEQDPTKPEYKQMAQASLLKFYQKKSTVYHTVLEVQRVFTRVVSGIKYNLDFTAAATACSVNVSSVRARSCKAVDDVVLYCHSDVWDRPWLKQKKIEVQCNGLDYDNVDIAKYGSDNDSLTNPSHLQKNNLEKYIQLAEEASEKFLTTSNRKYVHKVTEVVSASEHVDDGTLINIDYILSPTTCLRNVTTDTTPCMLKHPLVVFNCNANIRERKLQVEKEIKVTCKKVSETKGKKHKRESGVRIIRQIGEDDDEIDEDTAYYYGDRAVQHINDRSNSNNLHKLISIYAVKSSVQMGTLTVKMYIEVAETFCLRHHKSKDLRNCEEMNGLSHRLCLARLWPSPDDELVVRHVSVVCDDEADFISITGVNLLELVKLTLAVLEEPPDNHYKLVHQGEPQLIPSLDSRRPFKLNLVVAVTNCSKDTNLNDNPFQCYLISSIPPRNCFALIWLKPEAKYISNIDAQCSAIGRTGRLKRSTLDPENVTLDYSEIQNMVTASLEQLEMQSLHRYKQRVLQINSHSTKITSGKVTTIDFDVGYTSCLKYEWVANITSCNFLEHLPRRRCVAQIWERLWINNGKNIDVNCVDDETPLESHIEFQSAEMANELARQALKHIEAKYPHPSKQKVVRIFSLEKQVVAGIHYKMKIEVGFTDCIALSDQKECKFVENHGLNKFCRVNVWIRPWTDHPPNFRVSCDFQEGTTHDLYHHVQSEHLFYNFLTTYSPSYVNNYSQMHKRFEIFKNNIKKIHELNIHEKGTAMYGVTRFSDLTYEEFSATYMGLKTNLTSENQVPMKQADIPNIKIPQNFDWREYDAVTDVKDQGSCGSCWAFSVTGNIEGQWKMQSGQLVSLSEQELVDCDKLDDGCNGGLPDNAYRAIEQMGGLELESDYPYEGTDDKCVFNKTLAKVQISSAVNITTNETGMAQWLVHNGPISIGINANAMQFYMGGISHPWKMLCNPTNLDHGVLIVGYGVKDYPLFHKKLPYWIVKNSWGKSWGEQGYYRVYRGDGTCGVNQMASSAVI